MPLRAALARVSLVSVFVAVVLFPAALFAQSPELSLREFASGQIKKGVRSIGFGGDGATGGNYALVYRDAGGAFVAAGWWRWQARRPANFDFLAAHYRWMEWVLAGRKLQRCREAFLGSIPPPRREPRTGGPSSYCHHSNQSSGNFRDKYGMSGSASPGGATSELPGADT